MPAQHFVPRFAQELQASSRVQANALKALALANPTAPENEWKELAAAALMVGAKWEGEQWEQAEVAKTMGISERKVGQHYQMLADTLRKAAK